MVIKAVLFDIDGTLVDSNEEHITAWQTAFATIGKRFDRTVIHDQIGKGTDMLVPTLLPELDEDSGEALGEVHGRAFKTDYLDAIEAFPNARDLLAHVHGAGQQVVFASSASKEELDHYISLLDAHELVTATTSSDNVARTKPAPDIFAIALEKLAPLSADEVVVVGDTPYDIEAAAKCGIAAIGLRSGRFSDDTLRGAGAVAHYDDVAHLLAEYDQSPIAAS